MPDTLDDSIRQHRALYSEDPVRPALRTAVLVPAYNEQVAIAHVVRDFRTALPDAVVYVYDNNSTDGTAAAARMAGAVVRRETLQGKGHVVRRMFADIDADVYVLVDGDNTYDATTASAMVNLLIEEQLDMVTGLRVASSTAAYRRGHVLGNAVLTGIVRQIFGNRIGDMLSGYRVFSRRFVKSFPALASGFETETEFTIHALELRMPIREVATTYRERASGSVSKLRTYADGLRLLRCILMLVKDERPLQFFSAAGLLLLLLGLGLGLPVVIDFFHTGLVLRLPTAVLSTGLVMLSFLSFACGLILDSVARGRREIKRLAYLSVPGVGSMVQALMPRAARGRGRVGVRTLRGRHAAIQPAGRNGITTRRQGECYRPAYGLTHARPVLAMAGAGQDVRSATRTIPFPSRSARRRGCRSPPALLRCHPLPRDVGGVAQVHRRVRLPRILQAQLGAMLANGGHHLLAQQLDAAAAVLLRHGAVIAPDAHDARTGLLDQHLQPGDHLVRRAGNDHGAGDLLLEGHGRRAGSSPAPPRIPRSCAGRKGRNSPPDWPKPDAPGR